MFEILFITGVILFIFTMLHYFGQSLINELSSFKTEVKKQFGKIDKQCKFEKNTTDDIRSDIEVLTNEIYQMKYGEGSGQNILIFDDENWSRDRLKKSIRSIDKSCNIRTANNMKNAMFHIKAGEINTIFADLYHKNEEYGLILYNLIIQQKYVVDFILYSGGEKPEKYDGIFLDKMEIMKNPDILKEYL